MPRFAKSLKAYQTMFETDWKALEKGLKKVRAELGEPKKVPTSVALDPRLVTELKKAAQERGIPYQVLMRMFIIDGFERMKKAGSSV
jgi:predicted DNA binding CopG/RHH family protein